MSTTVRCAMDAIASEEQQECALQVFDIFVFASGGGGLLNKGKGALVFPAWVVVACSFDRATPGVVTVF